MPEEVLVGDEGLGEAALDLRSSLLFRMYLGFFKR